LQRDGRVSLKNVDAERGGQQRHPKKSKFPAGTKEKKNFPGRSIFGGSRFLAGVGLKRKEKAGKPVHLRTSKPPTH